MKIFTFLKLKVALVSCLWFFPNAINAQNFRASASAGATSGVLTLTINKPTGTLNGDGMFAAISVIPNTAIITPPSGWTLVRRTNQISGSAPMSLATFGKIATASEPVNYSWTFSASTGAAGGISSFYNIYVSNPINSENGQTTASALTHATPAVTSTVANTMVITAHCLSSSATWTPPTGMTESFDKASNGTLGSTGISVEVNYVIQPTAGSTGVKTATASNDADFGITQIFALVSNASATISYGGSPYCSNAGTASVTQTGTAGGTYSSTTGLTLNPTTGAVTLSSSADGTYNVTYTYGGSYITTTTITVAAPTISGVSTATCVGGSTGTITAAANGGNTPYTYSLNAGTYQSSVTFTGLAAGTYILNVKSNAGCIASSSVIVSDYATSTDNQNATGTNTWVGHMYDAIAFNTYIGQFTEAETFNETFGGDYACFNVMSSSVTRSIYTETFSAKLRMNSTRKGLHVVDLGSDDGSRLTIDGTLLFNNFIDQSYTSKPTVLINLNGASSLLYEFYESSGQNQLTFQNLTLVLANTLSTNTTQNICTGNTGLAISGDIYGTLPTGITLSGTGYQWSYSTTPGGTRTDISGATGATFTPSATVAPFNAAGTYYIFRKAVLSSVNNVSPNPYVATNESNAATITVTALPVATFSYTGTPYCKNAANPSPIFSGGGVAGTFSTTGSLVFVSTSTGQINLASTPAGTYTITNTIAASGGCAVVTATSSVTITALPVATFSYTGSPYCKNAANPSPTFSGGGVSGTFSSTAGLIFVSTASGEVDIVSSIAGTYTVTNTIASSGGCGIVTATSSVTITALPVATFSYASNPYCKNAVNPSPTFSGGGVAGVFSSTTGLVFVNTSTGQINLASSTVGTYTVTNTRAASGGCSGVTATSSITITAVPSGTFSYAGSPYCSNAGTVVATRSGTTGGTFSSTAGLSLNSTNGNINTSLSTAGTYTVTYTVAAAGGCAAYSTTASVQIVASLGNNSLDFINGAHGALCTTAAENASATLTAPVGTVFIYAGFTSYGTPGGSCSAFTIGSCHAITSQSVAQGYLLANNTASIPATNTAFGDPCVGTVKNLFVQATYTQPLCSGTAPGTLSGSDPTGGDGTYTYLWEMSTTSQSTGFSAASGTNNTRDYTPGTLTQSTWYRRTVTSSVCSSISGVLLVPVTPLPGATISYSGSPYCLNGGTASVTRTGTAGGIYTSTAGLSINASTGEVTLGTSSAGTYTVTYTIAAAGGCAAFTTNSTITITATPSATISYSGSPYCVNAGTASVTRTGTLGGTYSSTSGLTINASTGDVTLGASTAGTYTVTYTLAAAGGCSGYTTTASITVSAMPGATIAYTGSPYCSNGGTASVTFSGTTGGTYSSTAGLVISPSTGDITLGTSTAGTYTVTYTVVNGGCINSVTASVTVTALAAATFSYTGSPYCKTAADPSPTFSGGGIAGTFSSTAGLVFVSTTTGKVDLASSIAGTYIVTNTLNPSGGCGSVTATSSITITTLPVATFIYSGTPYCKNAANPSPTYSGGGAAGTFSSTAGLVFVNTATGQVNLASSTVGTYTITNTRAASGGCAAVTATSNITISTAPSATISYTGTPYCSNLGTASPSRTGTPGGTYTSTAGLSINAASGDVFLGSSSAGTYTVTYTIAASGGCGSIASTTSITISAAPAIFQIPTANLIGNYKFEGNANDASGNNNGTLQNSPSPTTDRFNNAGKAYLFNGSSQYVSTAQSYVNPNNFTLSIWFKTTTVTGGKLIGFGNAQTGTSGQYDRHIYMNNAGQIYFGVYPGSVQTVNTASSYNDGNWHLATATLSGTAGMALYMDGALVASRAGITTAEVFTGYWKIGYDNLNGWTSQPTSPYFNGSLDDVLIYQGVLTAAEITTLFKSPDGAGNNGPVCTGSNLNLTATTVSGAAYSWTGPNGFTSSLQNPTLVYDAANAGVYTLNVTTGSCTSTAYTTVASSTNTGQWTGNISSDWSIAGNWCSGVVPTSSTNVIITAGATRMPTIVNIVFCNSLTINAGATVTVASAGNLKIAGNLTNNGTYTDNGTTTFNGPPGPQTFSGITTFNNLTLNNIDGLYLPVSIVVKNNLTLSTGTLFDNNFNITVAGNWINNSSATSFVAEGGTVTLNGTTAQSLGGSFASNFNNLTISNPGTVSLSVNANIGANLLVSGGTFDLGAFTANRITAGGTITVSTGTILKIGGTNTFPVNYSAVNLLGSTVEYSGTDQIIASLTYGNLKLSSSTGAAIKTLPATPFNVISNLTSTVGSGTSVSFTAASNITVGGNVSIGTSTTFNGSSFNQNIGGNWTNSGTFNGNTGTVIFTGAGTVVGGTGAQNFNNLTVAASGVSFSAGDITLTGNLATTGSGSFTQAPGATLIMSGTGKTITGTGISLENLEISGSVTTAVSLPLGGNLSGIGSFNATAGTITMSGASKTISGSGTKAFYVLDVTGSIIASADFSIASGLFVNGSLAATAGTATFTGSSSLSGTANLYNTAINGTSLQLAAGSKLGIANTLTIISGTLNVSTSGPNTVNFNGSGAQNVNAITYSNLILSNGNTKTATGNIATIYDITIAPGTTFNPSSYTHSVYGNWINNGIFIPATSTVQFVGPATAYITGATTFNVLTSNTSNTTTELILQSDVSATTVNMINGIIKTGSKTITITGTRTGNGYIYGNIQRTHAFTTGVAYAFEGSDNTVTFSSVAGVGSITVSVVKGSIGDFPFGGSISREYNISVPAGTYNATLRLHYEDDELNGNNESSMALWHYNGSSWATAGKAANSTTSNYVEHNNLTDITNRWTLSDNSNLVRWNGSVSNDWNTANNWTVVQGAGSRPPSSTDIVDLGSVTFNNQPTISNSVTVKGIVFGSAKAVTLTLAGGGSLTTLGDINGNWAGNATHTIAVNNQSLTVNGNLDLSDGTNGHAIDLNIGTGTVTTLGSLSETGGANITFSGAGTLDVFQNFNYSSGTFTAGSGTVIYNGTANQDVANINYNHLIINKTGGLAAINDSVNIAGNLLISSGELDNFSTTRIAGNVTINAGVINNYQVLYVGGNWNNNGTYTGIGSSIIFNGSGAQTISASTFNNFIIDKPSGTATLTGNVLLTGDFTINAGTFDIQTYSFDRNLPGGTATTANGATFMIGANNPPRNFTNNIINPSSTTILYGPTPVFIGLAGITFGNLIFRGTGVKTVLEAMTVKGDLTIENSSSFNATSATVTLEGNWINNGTFIPSASTVLLNGTSKTVTGNTTFNKVTVSGTYAYLGNTIFNGLYTVTNTGIVTAVDGTLTTVSGDFTNNGGYINSSGTITYTGNVLQTLRLINAVYIVDSINFNGTVSPVLNSSSGPRFTNVAINNTGGVTAVFKWIVYNSFTIGNGAAWHGGVHEHDIFGDLTNNGTITSSGTLNFLPASARTINLGNNFSSTGVVDFGGVGAMTLAGTPTGFYDVLINNTNVAGVTPSSNWNVGNDFTINEGSVFNAATYSYLIGGDIFNKGTLNAGASTFTLNGSGIQDVYSNSAFNNLYVNKSAGTVTQSTDININGNLNFVSGKIKTAGNAVKLSSSATLTGAAQNRGWVNGNLQKNIATGATSKAFEIGDAAIYTPVQIAFANVTSAGNLTANTTSTDHPNITSSVINLNKSVNRYWTINNNGVAFTTYDATFNFVASDIDAGATTSAFAVDKYDGSSWSLPVTASPNTTNTKATGLTSFSDFAIGEVCNAGTAISYVATPYCSNAGTAAVTRTGTAGGTYTSTPGLSIDAATGNITLGTSTAGSYTVIYTIDAAGGCPVYTTTGSITITAAPAATISYASPYCSNAPADTVTRTGTAGGTYTSTPGLSINALTGEVTPSASTVGSYTITYTIAPTGGCAAYATTTAVIITATPSAIISYAGSPYCSSTGTATVTLTGTAGGTFSSTAGLSINATTGEINLSTSTARTYTVTYTVAAAGGCAAYTTTADITITTQPFANGYYANTPYCSNGGIAFPTGSVEGAAGTISSTAGLSINSTNGVIDLGASIPGSYTVTYTVAASGGCSIYNFTTPVIITTAPSATISYTGSPYCSNLGTASVLRTGSSGGSYSSTIGLAINSTTGSITLASSTPGTYTVTYIIAASGGCSQFTANTTITVSEVPSVSGTSTQTCVGGSTGTITGSASGGTAPYTYSLNAGAYQASSAFTGLAAGTYTLNVKSNSGCVGSTSVTVSGYAASADNQVTAGSNSWIGHMYDGAAFTTYIGQFIEAETFNELFGGNTTCFNVVSNSITRSIYTETFSVKFRMNSTKKGLYVANLGSDDGSRLTVDGALVYNNYSPQSFTVKPSVLINLNGSSSLLYEYFENSGNNQVQFQNLTLVLANALSTNTSQTICTGNTGIAITGDTYGTLPSGITLLGTGYQWSYSTTPGGVRTNIAGATAATFTPSASVAPFNTAGTYYVYRNASLSGTNNISPNPYTAINESNAATITIEAASFATISYTASPYCSNAGTASVIRTGTAGGTYTSTSGLSLDAVTGSIDLNASALGTYTITYTISSTGACGQFQTNASLSIVEPGMWTGAVNTDWNNAGNWLCGGIPTASTNIVIPSGLSKYPIITSGTSAVNDITIEAGASITVNVAILQIAGAISNAGIFDVTTGTVEMNGTTPQTIPVNAFTGNTIKNLVVSNNVILGGQDSITGVLSFGNTDGKTFSTGGYLTLKSSATGTARVSDITNGGVNNGNAITGAVEIERYIPARRAWRLLTSPVEESSSQTIHDAWQEGVNNTTLDYASNQNPVPGYGAHITKGTAFAQGFDMGINNNPSIKNYNNATGAWDALSSTNIPITDYPAYMLFVRGNRSTNLSQGVNAPATNTILRSKGELKAGDQSYDVAAAGFTVISNPFASAMDLNAVGKGNSTNIQDNFYVWDPKITGSNGVGGFVTISWDPVFSVYTITPFTGDGISQYIQSGAGFLARSANGTTTGTLVVKETDKTAAGSDNVNRPQNMSGAQKLVTNLYSVNADGTTSIVDGLLNSFSTGYSNAVDNTDAVKLGNFSESISTLRNGVRLTVERRQPVTQADTIFFNMLQMRLKQYTFEFIAENLNNPGLTAFFEDNYLNTSTPVDLNATTSISFTVTNVAGAWAPDRFRIVFRPAAPLPVTINSVKAWQQNDAIQVEWKVENETGIKQYEVERSADGLRFTRSTTVITTVNNHGVYSWLDVNAQGGYNYYRIKTIDVNGTVHYSSVVKAYMGKDGEQIVLDTKIITNGALTFKLINMPAGKYGVRLLNNLGQVIYKKSIAHAAGSSTEILQVKNHLVNGLYMLEFTKPGNKKITEKVIVE